VRRASVCHCKRETANGKGEADTRKKPDSMGGILSGHGSGHLERRALWALQAGCCISSPWMGSKRGQGEHA